MTPPLTSTDRIQKYYCPCHGYVFYSRQNLREHCKQQAPPAGGGA